MTTDHDYSLWISLFFHAICLKAQWMVIIRHDGNISGQMITCRIGTSTPLWWRCFPTFVIPFWHDAQYCGLRPLGGSKWIFQAGTSLFFLYARSSDKSYAVNRDTDRSGCWQRHPVFCFQSASERKISSQKSTQKLILQKVDKMEWSSPQQVESDN